MYAPVSDRRNEIWARRATVEQHRRRSALFGSRQPSCRTEQPEEYIGYDSLRSPLVPIDRRHFAKPFSVSQKLMVKASSRPRDSPSSRTMSRRTRSIFFTLRETRRGRFAGLEVAFMDPRLCLVLSVQRRRDSKYMFRDVLKHVFRDGLNSCLGTS